MPAKPVRISQHARFEMRRRGIRRGEVVSMIRHPGQIVPSFKGRHIMQGLIGRAQRLLLRVIVKEDTRAYHVVTAYKTSKVAKYWKTS
jgi:hypothetical protein